MKNKIKILIRKNKISNKLFIRYVYLKHHKRLLNLKKPTKFSEKIQWLKLYGNLEELAPFVDKYEVRSFVKKVIGEKYLIPIIGVYDSIDNLDINQLPESFVVKSTHSAGQNFIVKNKKNLNLFDMKSKVSKWLNTNYYELNGEENYKNITPRVVIEKYIQDKDGSLKDYKIYCFNGVPQFIQVISGRFGKETIDYYDTSWNTIDIKSLKYDHSEEGIKKPINLDEMIKVASDLSSKFSFVRVDLYNLDGNIFFGELTFTPSNGLRPFDKIYQDKWIGKFLENEDMSNIIKQDNKIYYDKRDQ